eukprot:scaffold73748_cov69-Phaeocystis_antarctica.AAC.8
MAIVPAGSEAVDCRSLKSSTPSGLKSSACCGAAAAAAAGCIRTSSAACREVDLHVSAGALAAGTPRYETWTRPVGGYSKQLVACSHQTAHARSTRGPLGTKWLASLAQWSGCSHSGRAPLCC